MKKETYIRMMDFWHQHPSYLRVLNAANKGITAFIYVAYPCLLLYLALTSSIFTTLRATLVPLFGLVVVSVLRNAINAPRPYQVFQTKAAISKNTLGKSLPSKHTFCIFIIGIAFLASLPTPAAGVVILILGIALASIRVLSGVHFIRDVLVAAALAILLGIVGFYLL